MQRFDGKVALVSGAASGIGRASCLRFASEGAGVLGIDIDAGGLAATAAQVKEGGAQMETGVFDVSRREQCFAAVETAVDTFGRLDVLANIAGIVRFSNAHEMDEEEWNLVLAINLSGPFFLSPFPTS
jgi:NAD(P)-dependent dehydrogenase (short-subunit alcohol dehydrogenase family)